MRKWRKNSKIILNHDSQNHYLGQMNVHCVHCNAKHFLAEKVSNKGNSFNDCCSHGAVVLDKIPEFPDNLRSLFDGSHIKSNLFFERLRNYNSLYAFASFNANLINFPNRRGPYCFKIQGQIYYKINEALYPSEAENPSYGQLFIIDPQEAIDFRVAANSGVDEDIMNNLEKELREHNILAKSYKMMKEEIENQRKLSNTNVDPELQLLFNLKSGYDKNRYNPQRVNEIAAVFVTTADGDIPESYVTIRNKNTRSLRTLSSMDPFVEPMIYPLFYPHGSQGWNRNIMRRKTKYLLKTTNEENSDLNFWENNKRVTRCSYIKHRISIRPGEFNAFLLGRRLFQQWIVDSYVKVEKDRIQYCKDNQKQLRAESYQGLIDHLNNKAVESNCQVGKMVILPSTFIGSPRYMMQNYQDSMAIVRSKGKPDLFITMTCNPNWPEITENLLPGQQASDRPDICARVFHLKKEHLMNLIITKENYFGNVLAHVHVVEFQKRGLPHAHILITLNHGSKFTNKEIVDKFISAEIPDPEEDPDLYNTVTQNMLHGPCNSRCIKDGKCSKHYPREFRNETDISSDGYPYYRRRNDGRTIERNNHIFDNRHVVPYCPGLLRIFNCHINVEVVSSIKAVKYLYKYIYKGFDAANIEIVEGNNEQKINHDEINSFIETRYVGPVEACYRILSKPLQGKSHSIVRLPVHLPNQQSVLINDINDVKHLTCALNKVTMLLDYFELNKRDNNARLYSYMEIPKHYVFKLCKDNGNKVHKWCPRKSHYNCIGRMYSVSPSQVELFRLRLLLLHVKGATSFDELRKVNEVQYSTYSETCLALGLIESDEEWSRALQEATSWMMPRSLRHLFVRILIFCQPIHPEELWKTFKNSLSEDYFRIIQNSVKAENAAYFDICDMLIKEGYSISSFYSMPELFIDFNEWNSDLDKNYEKVGNIMYGQLNSEQKEIVDLILESCNSINCNRMNCFYVDGPGGTGKTFIYNTIYNLLKCRDKNVCCMAFTGIAATLLPKGMTVHKAFGLPVPLLSDSSSNISVQSKEGEFLKRIDVFIWDEAPMAPRYALEIMDRTLKDVMNNKLSFGGKIVILGGDFRQLLPVIINGTRSEVLNLSIKNSFLWNLFFKFHLTQNMRAQNEEIHFKEFLLNIGNGDINDSNNNILIPERCLAKNENIVESIYGHLIKNQLYDEICSSAILSARNIDVDELNNEVVKFLDVKSERIYTSIDSVDNCDDNGLMAESLLPEYLNTLNPQCLPPHELKLRTNCIVMLIRNMSINEGLCNGTRLRVLELGNNLLKCKIITGDKAGDIVFLNRITLYSEKEYPFSFRRRQFPIKLAFAMTINKAQGQTFSNVGLDLRKDVFTHGQLYVALSRVRTWNGLKLFLSKSNKDNSVKNIVFKEIFV